MNLLFVCNFAQVRSRTSAQMYEDKYNVNFAGLFSNANPLTKELLAWSDKIFVFEEQQKIMITEIFPDIKKEIINLDISNYYFYNQPELRDLIEDKIKYFLPLIKRRAKI